MLTATKDLPDFKKGPKNLSVSESNKCIRKTLSIHFPGVKFSVRGSRGTSTGVSWIDGPTLSDVEIIVDGFSGEYFSGSDDCSYKRYSWLTPEGAQMASLQTAREVFNTSAPSPDAVLVSFNIGSVYCNREYSEDVKEAANQQIQELSKQKDLLMHALGFVDGKDDWMLDNENIVLGAYLKNTTL